MTATPIGIHDLSFATAHHVVDLAELANEYGIDVDKFYLGIGQREMSVPAEDEDIVTMGAQAARRILDRHGAEGIRTLLFATESGIDQSKSAGVYAHSLLGLPANCRVVELKQACYSATAALQFALGVVARDPSERVLVIASDIARYALGSSGEPTQGAAAVAFLVTANPALIEIEPATGLFTDDIHDFWRPNYRSEALVDGKFSMRAYLHSLEVAWSDYRAHGGAAFDDFARFCYHQPFTKMAVKAHDRLGQIAESPLDREGLGAHLEHSFELNRRIGNSYTASIYLGLLSLLNTDPADLAGQRVGFFSYGSGSVSELFAGVVRPGYREVLRVEEDEDLLASRVPVDFARYAELHRQVDAVEGGDHETPRVTTSGFRFAGVQGDARGYGRVLE